MLAAGDSCHTAPVCVGLGPSVASRRRPKPTRGSPRRRGSGAPGSGRRSDPGTTRVSRRVQRSALTVKGLTYMPTVRVTVAALTTDVAARDPGGRAELGLIRYNVESGDTNLHASGQALHPHSQTMRNLDVG